jgi:Cu2+-containing amine oxidase
MTTPWQLLRRGPPPPRSNIAKSIRGGSSKMTVGPPRTVSTRSTRSAAALAPITGPCGLPLPYCQCRHKASQRQQQERGLVTTSSCCSSPNKDPTTTLPSRCSHHISTTPAATPAATSVAEALVAQLQNDSFLEQWKPLSSDEMKQIAAVVRNHFHVSPGDEDLRFVAMSTKEPDTSSSGSTTTGRRAEVVVLQPSTGLTTELELEWQSSTWQLSQVTTLPAGTQPLLTPDDCFLAEDIVQASPAVATILQQQWGITDVHRVVCDPWETRESRTLMSVTRTSRLAAASAHTYVYE